MLLSTFSEDIAALLWGVNIGGLGTLIASMASLISYKFYAAREGCQIGKYMLIFTIVNVVLLILLTAFMAVWFQLM
jgi:Na+/H+ antiporter NhaD/arsenite permease-like protein